MQDTIGFNQKGEYVLRMMWDISTTTKLFDEINETLANNNKGIGKLINKYSISNIYDVGYGCTCFELEFDPALEQRDKKVHSDIMEYINELIVHSDWFSDYDIIHSVDQDGLEEVVTNWFDGDLSDAVNGYIDAMNDCGFTDDADYIIEVFEDYPEAAEIIEKRLMLDALSGKFIRKMREINPKVLG